MDVVGRYRPGCRSRPYMWSCGFCGRAFPAKRCTAMFCSPKCRKADSRAQAAARGLRIEMLTTGAPETPMDPLAKPQREETASQDRASSTNAGRSGGTATRKRKPVAKKGKAGKGKARSR